LKRLQGFGILRAARVRTDRATGLREQMKDLASRATSSRKVLSAYLVLVASAAVLAALVADRPGRSSSGTILEVSRGPLLLLDDSFIRAKDGLSRRIASPTRFLREPVVTSQARHRNWQPWLTVLYDPSQTMPFRMWYNAVRDPDNLANITALGFLGSRDGVGWPGPPKELVSIDPLTFGARVVDRGPAHTPAAERYAILYYVVGAAAGEERAGIWAAFSPDGLTWTPYRGNPVIPSGTDDIVNVFWDDRSARYVLMLKLYRPYTWRNAEGRHERQTIRLVGLSFSADLIHWSEPSVLFGPDDGDPGVTEWYGTAGILRRGDLWVGFLKVSRDDITASGLSGPENAGYGYTVLTWSRDGTVWSRDRHDAVFFGPDPDPQAWDHSHAWIDSAVRVGDELHLYYGGYARGHKATRFSDRQIGLVRMPLDRYAFVEAGEDGGRLETHALVFPGVDLTLNIAAPSGVELQLTGTDGDPLAGFSFADCRTGAGDAIRITVTCGRPFRVLQGAPVRIHLRMPPRSRLFAINLD
jgi:hypothetical protein